MGFILPILTFFSCVVPTTPLRPRKTIAKNRKRLNQSLKLESQRQDFISSAFRCQESDKNHFEVSKF